MVQGRHGPADGEPAPDPPSSGGEALRAQVTPTSGSEAPRRGSVAHGGEGGGRLSTAPRSGGRPGFELLDHTADVGVRARAGSLEEAFEQATYGLAEVLGAWRPGPRAGPVAGERAGGSGTVAGERTGGSEPVGVEVAAGDPGGLLVDWLNEVLWHWEARQTAVAGVRVERVADGVASGSVWFASGGPGPDGTLVKAVTYHRLRVEPEPGGGWVAEVYLDV